MFLFRPDPHMSWWHNFMSEETKVRKHRIKNAIFLCQLWQRAFTTVTTGFPCDTGFFPLWALTWENEHERGLTGWTTALDWELARSDSLAAGKELVTGSKIPSDLLQLKSGHSENLDFTHLFFVLRSAVYPLAVQLLMLNRTRLDVKS